MITMEMLERGFANGLVRFAGSPVEPGRTVCYIGLFWFNFDPMGLLNDDATITELLGSVFEALEGFRLDDSIESQDEYQYYEAMLT